MIKNNYFILFEHLVQFHFPTDIHIFYIFSQTTLIIINNNLSFIISGRQMISEMQLLKS